MMKGDLWGALVAFAKELSYPIYSLCDALFPLRKSDPQPNWEWLWFAVCKEQGCSVGFAQVSGVPHGREAFPKTMWVACFYNVNN